MKDLTKFIREIYHNNAFTTYTQVNVKDLELIKALGNDGVVTMDMTDDYEQYIELKYERVVSIADIDSTYSKDLTELEKLLGNSFSHCILVADLPLEQVLPLKQNCMALYLLSKDWHEQMKPIIKFEDYYLYQL